MVRSASTILHFSGHGSARGTLPGQRRKGKHATRDVSSNDHAAAPSLLVVGDDGQPQLVTPAALTKMIKSHALTQLTVCLPPPTVWLPERASNRSLFMNKINQSGIRNNFG
jgi:hypothetical protein